METNTKESLEGIDQKMKQAWSSYENEVAKLNEEPAQSFMNLFEQWNLDFQNFREKHGKSNEKKNDNLLLGTQNELKEEMNKLRRKIMKEFVN
ncbi:hypothetical protein A6R68_01282, partial [Neotoma lepida]